MEPLPPPLVKQFELQRPALPVALPVAWATRRQVGLYQEACQAVAADCSAYLPRPLLSGSARYDDDDDDVVAAAV